jgi:hypothetical protein
MAEVRETEDFAHTVAVRIAERARQLTHNLLDPYRPELHYMRGPGPKWREKHGRPPAEAHVGDLGVPNLWKAGS